ncbi:MAG TPA: glycosyltransferase family 39 protein, partial [Fimbriimonas sp.]|nr:glycosyltransferase family 39 protein [Fimbriimonas sp.]
MDASRKKTFAIAGAIFAFALLLRLLGIGWGLKNDLHNESYHPDEAVIFSYAQDIEPAKLQFTPGFYNYGTLYLTMLRVAGDMTAAYTGAPDPKSDDSFWSFASRVHLAGRLLSALAGAATAAVLFLIGLRFFGVFGGVAAGLAIAVSSAHAVHSRFQTVDIIATFFLALGTYYALKLLPAEDDEGPPVLK